RPKVKASGGLPVNRSSGVGRRTCRENVSAIESTSRWKCIVALGRPVVPEVNANMHTSSDDVATTSKAAGLAAARRGRSAGTPPAAVEKRLQPGDGRRLQVGGEAGVTQSELSS